MSLHASQLTFSKLETSCTPPSHEIPHLQGFVFPHSQRYSACGMYIDIIDPSRVAFEGFQQSPVGSPEDGDGRVHGRRDEM